MPYFRLLPRRVIEPTPIDDGRYGPSDADRRLVELLGDAAANRLAARWDAPNVQHLDGIEWSEAPIPPRSHVCWPQTSGWFGLDQIQRCACGAIRRNSRGLDQWFERNSRKAS